MEKRECKEAKLENYSPLAHLYRQCGTMLTVAKISVIKCAFIQMILRIMGVSFIIRWAYVPEVKTVHSSHLMPICFLWC